MDRGMKDDPKGSGERMQSYMFEIFERRDKGKIQEKPILTPLVKPKEISKLQVRPLQKLPEK